MITLCRFAIVLIAGAWLGCSVQAQVFISEFLASNSNGLRDEDGDTSDWIELHNPNHFPLELTGWYLTDDPLELTKWRFPAVTVPAAGFLIVFASAKDRAVPGAPLHANFSLDANGEYLALVWPNGTKVLQAFSPFPKQVANISYGRAQALTTTTLIGSNQLLKYSVPSNALSAAEWYSAAFDDSSWAVGTNGVGYDSSTRGFSVRTIKASGIVSNLFIAQDVIANASLQSNVFATNRVVINFLSGGTAGNYGGDTGFPGQSAGADDFVMEADATVTIPAAGTWTFGVNSDDGFKLEIGSFAMSWVGTRLPADTLQTFNFPAAGEYPLRLVYFERNGGAAVELFAAQGAFQLWNAENFRLVGETNGGLAVRSPAAAGNTTLGFAGYIRTDIGVLMASNSASMYLRIPFTVTNNVLESLFMRVRYDDGFVAYLNGAEVTRRNAPNPAPRLNHLAVMPEEINLSDVYWRVRQGVNLLAIHALNDSANGADFLFSAELMEFRETIQGQQFFSTPTPGGFNSTGFLARVADTKFSRDRGFYSSPFACEITTDTPEATIRYTLDGSMPNATNGFTYANPIPISGTTTLRAAAFRDGYQPSDVDTHTYIFVEDVIRQSTNGAAPPGWPTSWGANVVDYGMDQRIVNNPENNLTIRDDLRSIPSFSIVTDLKHLFDPLTGIYANPRNDEISWERPASMELIFPSGNEGFQINCGIRIRGGFSRNPANPKHAFRFFFREEYGDSKLRYPLFGDAGADNFDKIDLRTMQNYSWSYLADGRMICIRDSFSRDAQLEMGHPATRGDFYHLYVNGQYWGIYNIEERPEAAFGESYLGGAREDYDTIKVDPDLSYNIEATDGTLDAWFRLWQAATNGFASDADYQRVQGNYPDGTRNPAYENLIDVDNLIDYMLIIIYTGNLDAPVSTFVTPRYSVPNNFFAVRNRNGTAGFRFLAHDSEHTLLTDAANLITNRTGPIIAGDPTQGSGFTRSNPQYFWQRLSENAEFRLRVADHIQKRFFNGGALTPEANRARLLTRSNEIYRAIVAESARWGDAKRPAQPFTRNDWIAEMNRVYAYLGQRGDIVLNQLRQKNLLPIVLAPHLSHYGPPVDSGYQLHMTNMNNGGTIFYTIDGSDPRQFGGNVASGAIAYEASIAINAHTVIRARVLAADGWSPLVMATFFVSQDLTKLLVTEIMYNPPGLGGFAADNFEFLELKNTGLVPLDLSGLNFSGGINFSFTNGTLLAPGEFFLLARNNTTFTNKYSLARVNGIYSGRLDNAGETLALSTALGNTVFSFDYNNSPPWPASPDGHGFSLVPRNPNVNPRMTRAENWRASALAGGSPGADDPEPSVPTIYINELSPELDLVELHNPNSTSVDVAGWFLTDDRDVPKKVRLVSNTVIPSGGYQTFAFPIGDLGGDIYLFSGDSQTNLTGYSHGAEFNPPFLGETVGRHINSIGDERFVRQPPTLGGPNVAPRVGPIVLTDIMYHPPDDALGFDNQADEYLVFRNVGDEPVPLYDVNDPFTVWELRDAVDFLFPSGIVMQPGESIVVVSFDPNDVQQLERFRSRYLSLQNFPVYGPYSGKLDNSGDSVELYSALVEMERVRYADVVPWPPAADGSGAQLRRLHTDAHGNDATNWQAITPLTVVANPQSTNVSPASIAAFSVSAVGTGLLRYQWLFNGAAISGETNALLAITNARARHDGEYSVQVSDANGSGISASARLIVLLPPVFVRQPQTQTVFAGDNVTFRATVSGNMPIGYRWRRLGFPPLVNFPGAAEVTISNVPLSYHGSRFDCIVTNLANLTGVQSAIVWLYVVNDADGDRMSDSWENANGLLSNDPNDAMLDTDGDGVSNRDEYIGGTDPQNAQSYLRLFAQRGLPPSVVLRFGAVSNNSYQLLYADALSSNDWKLLAHFDARTTNRTILHTNLADGQRYYRLWTTKSPEP